MSLYRIYIDEVGNHDLKSADNPNERFLFLTGVVFTSDYIKSIVIPELNDIKNEVFDPDPDEPLILHRRDILKRRGPFKVLNDEVVRADFDDRILSALKSWDYRVITVVIDKLAHRDQYVTWRYHPYHYCLKVLLERYLLFLQSAGSRGDVMVESRGGKEDRQLKDSYRRLYCEGSEYIKSEDFQSRLTSKKLKLKPKNANIAGLQIADIVAYPSRREVLIESGLLTPKSYDFSDKITDILAEKYVKNSKSGEIWGWGKKLLP